MPYIDEKTRRFIDNGGSIQNVGELNYFITKVITNYIMTRGESYQTYNDVLGILTAIPLELYRRKIAQYEDEAIKRNGDVY